MREFENLKMRVAVNDMSNHTCYDAQIFKFSNFQISRS
jgi:hypothetical protein